MKIDGEQLLRTLARNAGLLAPMLVVAALVSIVLAAQSARQLATAMAARSQEGKARLLEMRREPMTADHAKWAARRVSVLVPAVRVQVSGTNVVVTAPGPEQFAEWMFALASIQSTLPGMVWETQHLCLSACEGGDAARAYVTAYRPRLAATE